MRLYWIKYRTKQKQFIIYWSLGKGNLGDYQKKIQKHTIGWCVQYISTKDYHRSFSRF